MTEWAMRTRTNHRHYNACTGQHIDLLSLAQMIREVTGADVPVTIGKEGLKPEYSGDNSRIINEIGDFEFTPLRKTLEMLRDYYKDNSGLIDPKLLLFDK